MAIFVVLLPAKRQKTTDMEDTDEKTRERKIYRVTIIGSICNLMLLIFKFVAGIVGQSAAMIADAMHSLSDFVTDIIVIVFVKISNKPQDKDHDFGHGKYETLATAIIGIILFFVGIGILWNGACSIWGVLHGEKLEEPGKIALYAALASIVLKEALYQYTRIVGEKVNSKSVVANAWHHRSDALSSVGTFIGIGGAIMGLEILDPLASLVVCGLIIKVAVEIYIAAFNQVIDRSADKETLEKIENTINSVSGVKHIDDVKTRMHGSKIYVDVEIAVDGSLTVYDGHKIAEEVHHKIEDTLPEAKHCMVHVNPYKEK